MAKETRTFVKGRMNKTADAKTLPAGEYVDAQNVRVNSTEGSDSGVVENSKGNLALTALKYEGELLSSSARCIGKLQDGAKETMYWFVNDPVNTESASGYVDMIVSFNTLTQNLVYHVVSETVLNFSATYLINSVNKIDDLLFFSDNFNPPRKINVTRNYDPPVAGVDQISEEDISVVKPPPTESPSIKLDMVAGGDNYIEDTFICFAYRYKYLDGEYSALSQFSLPAFQPSNFNLDASSLLNEGMLNAFNSATVSFNTGSSHVVGIDIVFKEADSNNLYVVDKLDKAKLGYSNNDTQQLSFTNGEIYTLLNSSELLRLYDNVPLLADAQTIMGNRLMYADYLEGRDLVDANGNEININYRADMVSTPQEVVEAESDDPLSSYDYYFASAPYPSSESMAVIDISSIPVSSLVEGATLSFSVEIEPSAITGTSYSSGELTLGSSFQLEFLFELDQNYSSLYDAFNSASWEVQVGTNGNYETSPSQWSEGLSFTDVFNYATPTPTSNDIALQPTITPMRSGRGSASNTCYQTDSPNTTHVRLKCNSSDEIEFVPNAIQYQEVNNPSINQYYQYFKVVRAAVQFYKQGSRKSLHSNRDYQLGIIYQDAEGRQTTTLTSIDNSAHNPAENSVNNNTIKATIPHGMLPPTWAERYKFVIKPSQDTYDTILTSNFYVDPSTRHVWVKLEGEQGSKLTEGQQLVVKADSNGPLSEVVKTTVLEVVSQPEDFISGNESDGSPIIEPKGLYAKFLPSNWSAVYQAQAFLGGFPVSSVGYDEFPPPLYYNLSSPTYDAAGIQDGNEEWEITQGSLVKIKLKFVREKGGPYCLDQKCVLTFSGVASQDYNNFKDFWEGEAINVTSADCESGYGNGTAALTSACNKYDNGLYDHTTGGVEWLTAVDPLSGDPNCAGGGKAEMRYQFSEYTGAYDATTNPNAGKLLIGIYAAPFTDECPNPFHYKHPRLEAEISVRRGNTVLAFETIPTKTVDEIYYEGAQSFDISGGYHMSGSHDGDQNQAVNTDGIINLDFFNCFQFSNGVESYKIKDSVTGRSFSLGNRVTSVSNQDYKQSRRRSSITYSGVYQEQNNVNRLNEFNLGLANYKDCEDVYGPIEVLHARSTDLLVLQEDKISSVLVGKNLLSDSTGGGVIASVPEVLGTQIARTEEYGISNNPESFVSWGKDIFFTDAKRGVVINLKGGQKGEGLNVVSNYEMDTWFRDLFQTSLNRQKLGGYDPYMKEYVLGANTSNLPIETDSIRCGKSFRSYTGLLSPYTFNVELGGGYGTSTIQFTSDTGQSILVEALYDGTTTSGTGIGLQSFTVDKDNPSVSTVQVTITPPASPTSTDIIEISVGCPVVDSIYVVPVVLTSSEESGDTIHIEDAYEYNSYTSPFNPESIEFITSSQQQYISSTLVTKYGPIASGPQGTGNIPIDGATVRLYALKQGHDTFTFDTTSDRFRYLRQAGPILENNAADIATMVGASTGLTTIITGAPNEYYGEFTLPSGSDDDYLYLIWDFRQSSSLVLCYSNTTGHAVTDYCCECFSSESCVPFTGTTVEIDSTTACAASAATTYYTSVVVSGGVPNTEPEIGTTIYSHLGCGDPLTDQEGFIKFGTEWIEIDANGEVIDKGNC